MNIPDRRLPPGSGIMIAVALSLILWGLIVLA